MIAVDASVLIAHMESGNAHHHRAVALLRAANGVDLALHAVNAAEVLVNPVRRNASAEVLRDWSMQGVVVVPTDEASPVRLAALRVRTGLKMPDCCVIDVAQQRHAAVATFDDRLARAARDLGLDVVGAESAGGA